MNAVILEYVAESRYSIVDRLKHNRARQRFHTTVVRKLQWRGISSFAEAEKLSDKELLRIRGIGTRAVRYIRNREWACD